MTSFSSPSGISDWPERRSPRCRRGADVVLLALLAAEGHEAADLAGDHAGHDAAVAEGDGVLGVLRLEGAVRVEDRRQERLGRAVVERGEVGPDLGPHAAELVAGRADRLEDGGAGLRVAGPRQGGAVAVDHLAARRAGGPEDGRRATAERARRRGRASRRPVRGVDLGGGRAGVLQRREQRGRPRRPG